MLATSQDFPTPKDPANLQGDEVHYEKWNANARNTLFRGLCKDVFNHVRNYKDAHTLWSGICVLHEGTKSEREECYHLVMKKLNSFEMLPSESANKNVFTLECSCRGGQWAWTHSNATIRCCKKNLEYPPH